VVFRIAVTTIGLAVLSGCSVSIPTSEPLPTEAAAEPVVTPQAEVAEPTAEERAAMRAGELACVEISIAAVGDIMLGTDFPQNQLSDDDAQTQLADVTPTLSGADVAIGNLEGVLMDGGEPVKQCKNPDACYLFRSPARYAVRLADAGFDVMSLANNHARDFGEDGRNSSMAALDEAGILHSGRMGDIASWNVGEIRLAFIAFAPFTNSWSMLDLKAGASEVNRLAENHDIVIVSFHGGAEGADALHVPFTTERYYGEDRGDVVEFSRAMIRAGADLVIGHGPHVPRAMEIQSGRLVAYSLGNFSTYYGINVSGVKGYAPVLLATLDGNGQFKEGRVVSAIQTRPDGPLIDDRHRAYNLMRDLTEQDFGGDAIVFHENGTFSPAAPSSYDCSQ
jgi:poly-gamma-glutamate capsule biosynthesis protein CapA/YwtB (metallophosphatase superfamily)